MRRIQILATVALVHALLVLAAGAFVVADIGRHFPRSPSLAGDLAAGVMYVLGFPLVTGSLLVERFPFFGPAWQAYAIIAANSLLWALAATAVSHRGTEAQR